MGLLTEILAFPLMGPLRGLNLIGEKVKEVIDQELLGQEAVQRQLVELELQLELGEIGEEEYLGREAELLERLDAVLREESR